MAHAHIQMSVVELAAWIAPHPPSADLPQLQPFFFFFSFSVRMCVWSCTHSWGYGFWPPGVVEGKLRLNDKIDQLS